MDKTQALQNLLNGMASEEEINLLKEGLLSGEISIGGNVNQSVIIIGSGNTVELPPAALDKLGGRSLLGDLDRDLTGDEIAVGLNRLEAELPIRAPILLPQFQEQTRRLRPSLKTNAKSLSDYARRERVEALAQVNSLCIEALDISFNALCLGEELPEYDSRSPFRGLESFRPEDSEFFFGREALTKKLVAKIQSHPFLAVLGASGSGKSSLVMAGLIRALGSDYFIFRPGTNPLEALGTVKENALIVVDQFEELFTLTRYEATRKEFIARLLETTKQNKVVITLRSDFLGEVAAYRNLNEEVQSHLENVPPMNMDELRRAMEGQANQVSLRFEADLSQQILDDVEGEPGAMPLLQHALWELWNRRHGQNLRASEYRAFGGVKRAITSTAEKVYGECAKEEQEQIRDIFLRLTRLDDSEEGRDTRRSVATSDLIPSGHDTVSITLLLDKLANARLIVKTVEKDNIEIEVAHEALIRHWERLRGWLNEDRNNLQLRESVSGDAREWENTGRDESLLNHRGGRLEDALSLGDNSRYGLTEIEQAYLKACVSLRNREQRERERRLRWTVTASIAAAIIFLILGGFGLVKSNDATARANDASTAQAKAETNANVAAIAQAEAETKTKEITAVLQANHAKTLRNEYITDLSLEMALDAREKNPTSLEIQRTLTELALAPGIFKRTDVNAGSIFSLALSDDGTLLVSGHENGKVIIWDAKTLSAIREFYGKSNDIVAIAISPEKDVVATAASDQSILLWGVNTGQLIRKLLGHTDLITSLHFNQDGKYILSASYDGTVRLWDLEQGSQAQIFSGEYEGDVLFDATFLPDESEVVGLSKYRTVYMWDADTGNRIQKWTYDDGQYFWKMDVSKSGKYMAVAAGYGALDVMGLIINLQNGETLYRLDGHTQVLSDILITPDEEKIITGSNDNSVRVWDLATGDELLRLDDHDAPVSAIQFDASRELIYSGSEDGSIRVWDIRPLPLLLDIQADSGAEYGWVNDVRYSDDGKLVVGALGSNLVQLWDAESGKLLRTFRGHEDVVHTVLITSQKDRVISGSRDGTIRIWDLRTGEIISKLEGIRGEVANIDISSGDQYLIAGHEFGYISLWDLGTMEEVYRSQISTDTILGIAFNSTGDKYVTGSWAGEISIRNTQTGNEILHLTGHPGGTIKTIFSPDDKLIISSGFDNTIRIWDAQTGKLVKSFQAHTQVAVGLAISSDGQTILSGGRDGTLKLWDLESGYELYSFEGHHDGVQSVAFSPDSLSAISGSRDDHLRFWFVPPSGNELVKWAETERFVSKFTCAERELYQITPLCSGGNSGFLETNLSLEDKLLLANRYYNHGINSLYQDDVSAVDSFQKAIELNPEFDMAYLGIARAKYSQEKYEDAIYYSEIASKINQFPAFASFIAGDSYCQLDQYKKCIEALSRSIEIDPLAVDAHFYVGGEAYFIRGNAHYSLGEYSEAIKDFKEFRNIVPSWYYLYDDVENRIGWSYYHLDDFQKAIESFSGQINKVPNSASGYDDRGYVYYQMREYELAVKDLEMAIQINPKKAYDTNFERLAMSYYYLGNLEKCNEYLLKLLELGQYSADSYTHVGKIYYWLDEYGKAIESLSKALELQTNHPEALRFMGWSYYQLDEYPLAVEHFSRSIDADPKVGAAYDGLGWTYYWMEDYQNAIKIFARGVENAPGYKSLDGLYDGLGWSYYMLGDYEKAIEQFNEALKISPKYSDALDGLGRALYRNGDAVQAKAIFDHFIELYNGQAEKYSWVGWSYYYLENNDLAIEYLEKAAKINPRLSSVYRRLGDVYYESGQKQESLKNYQKYISLVKEPEAKVLDRIEELQK